MNNNIEKESKIIVWLALIGLLTVAVVVLLTVLNDRGYINIDDLVDSITESKKNEEQEKDTDNTKDNNQPGVFERPDYGVKFKYQDQEVIENPALIEEGENASNFEVIDCRKMSTKLRESLTNDNNAVCYEVMIKFAYDNYIVITTGDGPYNDPRESYIEKGDDTGLHIFPLSEINLPLERITISSFPTNLQGTRVIYENGQEYTFYEGIVYKGADKYAIKITGSLDDEIKQLLGTFELE